MKRFLPIAGFLLVLTLLYVGKTAASRNQQTQHIPTVPPISATPAASIKETSSLAFPVAASTAAKTQPASILPANSMRQMGMWSGGMGRRMGMQANGQNAAPVSQTVVSQNSPTGNPQILAQTGLSQQQLNDAVAAGDITASDEFLRLIFDHNLTGYPLTGKHQQVGCSQCHSNSTYTSTPTTCIGCHANDDIHHGFLPNCEQCHNTGSWKLY